jgi:MerR family transcriptional regulator, copper efflux regulator
MQIGEAAAQSGVSAKMIRYYEEIGLVPRSDRQAQGYRDYDDQDVHRLRFVARARDLGFSIKEIAELLRLYSDRRRSSSDVKRIALKHVAELETKIRAMRQLKRTIQQLADRCHGDQRPDCPILDDLARWSLVLVELAVAPAAKASGDLIPNQRCGFLYWRFRKIGLAVKAAWIIANRPWRLWRILRNLGAHLKISSSKKEPRDVQMRNLR